jgi:Toprim-like
MSLIDALRASGVEVHPSQQNPAEISICCPFCESAGQTKDWRFRLGINIVKDVAHCFNCGWRSRKAIEDLTQALGLGVFSVETEGTQSREEQEKLSEPALPEDFTRLYKRPSGILFAQAEKYLKRRGVTKEQIEEKEIGVSFVGKYAYRIIFPIYCYGELMGVVARDFTGKQTPPYLNTSGMKSLYNCPDKKRKSIVLCEGVFDCLAIERTVLKQGNCDVAAVLGRSLTDRQEEQLEDYRDIYLWPDADLVGIKGFIGIAKQLREHRVFIVPPFGYGKDAAEMDPSDRAYIWATRTRFTESMEMRIRAEVAFGDG